MLKKLLITSVTATTLMGSAISFAGVTMDKNPTDERADRRAITEAVKKLDLNIEALLLEAKKTNALLEEMNKKGGALPASASAPQVPMRK